MNYTIDLLKKIKLEINSVVYVWQKNALVYLWKKVKVA